MTQNSKTDIKVIIFDLGKVIMDFDHMQICKKLADHSRLEPDRIYEIIFNSGLESSFDKGIITPENFYTEVKEEVGFSMDIEQFKDIWENIFTLIPGIENILSSFKDKYKLLCLSNTNKWHFEYCMENFPVLKHFDSFILSYELGKAKPETEIFEKAIQKSGNFPSECIYIDDIVEFVEKAKEAGINGIHFTSADALKKDLQKLNLI